MNRFTFTIGTVFTMGLLPCAAQDLAAGEEIYQDTCRTCHGPNAQGLGIFPKLAGAEEDYLIDRLETYRAGESVGPNSALMIPHAAELAAFIPPCTKA